MSKRISKRIKKKKRVRTILIVLDCFLIAAIAVIGVTVMRATEGTSVSESGSTESTTVAETEPETPYDLTLDTSAPDIWSATYIYCSVGDTLTEDDYLDYVYIYDDYDESPSVSVDFSDVDTGVAGTYGVTYSAEDAAGNVRKKSIDVIVCDDTPAALNGFVYDEADLYVRCQSILDEIVDDSMTDLQKVFAVFYYIRNLRYATLDCTMEYKMEAYYFLTVGSDNCYGNVSVAKVLLEMLGYDCFIITGYDMDYDTAVHYWNMVSIDGGDNWYYFDPATWTWKNEDLPLCMVTEDVLLEISERHGGIHNFDSSLYPTNDGALWTEETAESLGISLTG